MPFGLKKTFEPYKFWFKGVRGNSHLWRGRACPSAPKGQVTWENVEISHGHAS
jgi:hypothetical protein